MEGLFYNYFSVGLDAQAAYGFHHLRESKPWAAPSRLINQAWYAYFSCASGWFCCAPPLNTTATLKVNRLLLSSWTYTQLATSCLLMFSLQLRLRLVLLCTAPQHHCRPHGELSPTGNTLLVDGESAYQSGKKALLVAALSSILSPADLATNCRPLA